MQTIRSGPVWRWIAGLAVMVAGISCLAVFLKTKMNEAVTRSQIDGQIDPHGKLRPLAEVAQQVRMLKLATVEVRSKVTASSESVIWRGYVRAETSARVRYVYGVDLSTVPERSFLLNVATHTYSIDIPRPVRTATEIGSPQDEKVEMNGLRTRGGAGETQLALARLKLPEEADRYTLSPEDLERVERETLEQVREMLQRIVGTAQVSVNYK